MIDLAEYTPRIIKFIKQRELCAVCLFAHDGKPPCKLTYGADPEERLKRLQQGNPYEIGIEYLIWTPGESVAKLIVSSVMQVTNLLGNKRLMADWNDSNPVILVAAVTEAVHKFYSDAQIVDHADLMRLLKPASAAGRLWAVGRLA